MVMENDRSGYLSIALKNITRSASFTGTVDDESVEAVQLLFSKCRALQQFTLRGTSYDWNDIGDGNTYENILDLSQAKSLRQFIWSSINAPVEVILPSQFQKIEIIRDSVTFFN